MYWDLLNPQCTRNHTNIPFNAEIIFHLCNSNDNEVQGKTYRINGIHKIENSSFHIAKISVVPYVLKTNCFNPQFTDMDFMYSLHHIYVLKTVTKRHKR